jgi:HAE1 family hydrophobic/amphiphilic exporter-1
VFRLAVLSLRHRAVVALMTLAIIGAGIFSLTDLKRELMPSFRLASIAIVATYQGASPEVVYGQVTTVVETAARGVSGVANIYSTVSSGLSITAVDFTYGSDLDEAEQKVETALSRVQTLLPTGTETQVLPGSLDDLPIVQVAVSAQSGTGLTPAEIATRTEQLLVPKLEDVPQVRGVELSGFADRVITIKLKPEALTQYGLTVDRVMSVLSDNGAVIPAGTIDQGRQTFSVQLGDPIETIEQIKALPLSVVTVAPPPAPATTATSRSASASPTSAPPPAAPSQTVVTVSMVADTSWTQPAATSQARVCQVPFPSGQACPAVVALAITKTPEGNTVEVSHAVADQVAAAAEELAGQQLEARVVYDQAPYVEQSISTLATEGLIGLAACVLVILLFLLSFRSTLVSAVSIPLSILAAFIALRVTDETLNVLTIGALAIAIGRVVDDSIVVIENIKRHLSYGLDKQSAIVTGVREVAGAVAASTVCTVAVFLPIVFVSGVVGELFRPFAWTVTIAMLASLFVALTIVPVLAYWFLPRPVIIDQADAERWRQEAESKEQRNRLQRAYLWLLRGPLAHPILVVLAALVILAGTVWFARGLPTNFMAMEGQDTATVTVTFPPNTSAAALSDEAAQVEAALNQLPDYVTTIQTTIGSGSLLSAVVAGTDSTTVTFSVTLTPERAAEAPDRIRQQLDGVIDQGQVTVAAASLIPVGGGTVDLIIRSDDPAQLEPAAQQVQDLAAGLDQTEAISNNLSDTTAVFEVHIDRVKALARGLTETQLARAVAVLATPTTIGQITSDSDTVTVQMTVGQEPATTTALLGLPVASNDSGPVTLGQLADLVTVQSPANITTYDGKRSATISVTPADDDLGQLTQLLEDGLAGLDLPAGVSVTVSGLAQLQDEAFGDLGLALLIAIALVYIVMVATFGSLIQPLLLLVAVPFAGTGALAALLLSDSPLGVEALIGLLMLVGIVVSNAIVLIDLINQYRLRPESDLVTAIKEGARQRLRPILMTAAATCLALTPMALGLTGHSVMLSKPLALVVIGGLLSSTVLTLLVVPALYLLEARAHDRRLVRQEARMEKRRRARAERLGIDLTDSQSEDLVAATPISPASPAAAADAAATVAGSSEPTRSPDSATAVTSVETPTEVSAEKVGSAAEADADTRSGGDKTTSPATPAGAQSAAARPPDRPLPGRPPVADWSSRPDRSAVADLLAAADRSSRSDRGTTSTAVELSDTAIRRRDRLFHPDEIESGPSTAELLLAELDAHQPVVPPVTGERLRPPLFEPQDLSGPVTGPAGRPRPVAGGGAPPGAVRATSLPAAPPRPMLPAGHGPTGLGRPIPLPLPTPMPMPMPGRWPTVPTASTPVAPAPATPASPTPPGAVPSRPLFSASRVAPPSWPPSRSTTSGSRPTTPGDSAAGTPSAAPDQSAPPSWLDAPGPATSWPTWSDDN